MTMRSISGFELPQALYAPHKDWTTASQDIKNYLFDGKKVWLEIERLLRDGAIESDRQWLTKALSEISLYTSNPASLPTAADKNTMGEYEKRIKAFIAIIDAAKVAAPTLPKVQETEVNPEILAKARNPFEEFLLSKGYNTEHFFDARNPVDLERELEFRRSFALTVILRGVRGADFPNMVTGVFKNFSYTSQRFNGTYTVLQLVETSGDGIPAGPERDATVKVIGESGVGKLSTDVQIIEEVFSIFEAIRKPLDKDVVTQQSLDAMSGVYVKLRTLNMFDVARIDVWGDLPALLQADMQTPEKVKLGDLYFAAFREIMRTGRKWGVAKDSTGRPIIDLSGKPAWVYPEVEQIEVNVDDKSGKNLMVFDGTRNPSGVKNRLKVWIESFKAPVAREDDQSLFPEWDAGGQSDVKPDAITRLRVIAARAAKTGDLSVFEREEGIGTTNYAPKSILEADRTLSGDVATLLAYHLAVISGEADFQDNVAKNPVGRNIFARMLQALGYTLKTNTKESQNSKSNLYTAGRMKTYFRTFWKFVCTDDGKTGEQAIMLGKSWKDVKLSGCVPQLTAKWCDFVLQAFGEYQRNENGLKSGPIFKIAEIDFKEGRVTVNQEVLKQVQDMLRFSWKYYVERDQSPSAIVKNWAQKTKEFARRTNISQPLPETLAMPSEEFSLVTVVDANGDIVFEKNGDPYINRVPQSIYVDGLRLGFWVRASRDLKKSGPKEVQGKGYTETKVVKHKVKDSSGNETGQQYDEVIIRLKPGVDPTLNRPSILIRRLLYQYDMDMISLPGDTIAKIQKKDIIAFGLAISPEMRKKYMRGDYTGLARIIGTEIAGRIGPSFGKLGKMIEDYIKREDVGIIPFDEESFDEDQFFEWLSQAGNVISRDDFAEGREILSSFFGGVPQGKPGGKH